VPAVLFQASFKLETCQVNAIVGKTGSGKSTILKLLCRLYDPDSGTIKFGTYDDLKLLNVQKLRDEVAFISASSEILKGTILSNLKLGKRNADMSEIKAALKLANADFVFKLKDNYDALVGYEDRGVELTIS